MAADRASERSALFGYGAAIAVAALVALLSVFLVKQVRDADYEAASGATLKVARFASESLSDTFEDLDGFLKVVGRLYVDSRTSGPEARALTVDFMKKEIARHPGTARIFIADRDGRGVLGEGPNFANPAGLDVSDRTYFRQAADGERGLIFEGPTKSKVTGEQIILLARRLEDDRGDFLGVVTAGFPVTGFSKVLSVGSTGKDEVVSIWTDPGGVLVGRHAPAGSEPGVIGVDRLPAIGMLPVGRDHDIRLLSSPIDHVERLVAQQRLRSAPFVVIAGQPIATLDRAWRRLAAELGVLSVAVAISTVWTARRLRKAATLLEDDNRLLEARVSERTAELEERTVALSASEQKFRVAMASAPNGMAILSPQGRILEANGAASDVLGYTRGELLSMTALDLASPEEAADVRENIQRIVGGRTSTRVVRRWLRKDGRPISVELDTSVVLNALGAVEHMIVQFHDISARLSYEARLRALLDTSVDGVCIYNVDGAIVDFSPSVSAALGYGPDELKTMTIADIDVEKNPEELRAAFRALAASGRPVVIETRHRRKDGSIMDVEISVKAVSLGGATYIYSSSRDITERKRAGEALDRSRQLLQDLVDSVPYEIAVFDERRMCVVMNEPYKRIFGLPREMLDGGPLRYDKHVQFAYDRGDFGYEKPVDVLLAEFDHTIQSGQPLARERRLPDGRWIRMRRDRLPGRQILMTALDVTGDKAMQEDLRAAKERLEAAAAAGVVGVWSYEVARDALVWDDVMLALHGLSKSDFDPSCASLVARIHPDDRERFIAAFDAALKGACVMNAEFRIVTPDGSVRHLRTFAKQSFGPDRKPIGLVGVTYDVTAETEALHALAVAKAESDAANRSKSDFLANMSHEMRTPLNAIVGTTELLARSTLNDDQARAVRTLESSSRGMIVLVTDLLDLSKIESGQLEIDEVPFRLGELVDSVASTFSAVAARKGVVLRVEHASEALPPFVGDPIRLGQVLNNFVSNALKFTLQGAVTIVVAVLARGSDTIRVRVAVRDTGIGIAANDVGKLFEPFVQVGRGTYRHFGGTGLGLSIAKRLIGLMGGEVGVESKPGEGSTFWFEVAFRLAPKTPFAPDLPGGRDGKKLDGVRILVVDDTATNREVAVKLLELEGASCETAENGLAAVARLRAGPSDFDAVLMDVQMPEMDGLEATVLLRRDPAFAELPVIALTAGAMASQRELALSAGMNGFVAKPFRLRELVATLTRYLGRETVD